MSVIPLTLEGRGDIGFDEPDGPDSIAETQIVEALPPSVCRPRYRKRRKTLGAHSHRPAALCVPLHIRCLPNWKRAVDVIGSILGLLVLSPLMLSVAAAVKFSSRGPVIFRQKRAGLAGRPFTIYKFRTMLADASVAGNDDLRVYNEQDGPVFKMRDDPRLTIVGKFLRRTSLDELPQLWNVLRGDMSLVGPRPLEWSEAMACDPWEKRRLEVTPGITCIWQVSGRSNLSFAEWIRMDLDYVRRRGFWLDLWLLTRTIPAVLFRRGAI